MAIAGTAAKQSRIPEYIHRVFSETIYLRAKSEKEKGKRNARRNGGAANFRGIHSPLQLATLCAFTPVGCSLSASTRDTPFNDATKEKHEKAPTPRTEIEPPCEFDSLSILSLFRALLSARNAPRVPRLAELSASTEIVRYPKCALTSFKKTLGARYADRSARSFSFPCTRNADPSHATKARV